MRYEEKLEVLETVHKIREISCLAQREGLLALEDVAAAQEDMFFKSCLLLATDGVSPEELEEYASIHDFLPPWGMVWQRIWGKI